MSTPQPPASRPIHAAGFLSRMPAGGVAYVKPSAISGDRVTTEDVGCVGTVVKIYNSTAPYLLADKAEVRWDDGATSHEPIRDLTVQASAPNPSPSSPDRETEIRQAIRDKLATLLPADWEKDFNGNVVIDAAAELAAAREAAREKRIHAPTLEAVIHDLVGEAAMHVPNIADISVDPNEISHDNRVAAQTLRDYAERLRKHPFLIAREAALQVRISELEAELRHRREIDPRHMLPARFAALQGYMDGLHDRIVKAVDFLQQGGQSDTSRRRGAYLVLTKGLPVDRATGRIDRAALEGRDSDA